MIKDAADNAARDAAPADLFALLGLAHRRVRALRNYARLSRIRFDNGAASYVEVLVAENDLFGAELNAVSSQADRLTQIVNVYKAIGGGWVDLSDQFAGPASPR